MWPEAPLFTTVANFGNLGPLDEIDIRTSYLQKWYQILKNHKFFITLYPRAIESIDTSDYDVVLSSSYMVGKGVIPKPHQRHVCYCHTPMRFAWVMEDDYLQTSKIPTFLQPLAKWQLKKLRKWDLQTNSRVDQFIANSKTTQARIKKFYNRESVVIEPPVQDRFYTQVLGQQREGYVAFGRMVPYKRFDLLVQAANVHNFKLTLAGTGSEEARLKAMAGPNVTFLGRIPDSEVAGLYARHKALLYPQFEDAGIVPKEAQATGTPVIGFGKGGLLETVKNGKTGVLFKEQKVPSLLQAMQTFEAMNFDEQAIRTYSEQFNVQRFREKLLKVVGEN